MSGGSSKHILTHLFKNPLKESLVLISPSVPQTLKHRSDPEAIGEAQGKTMLFETLERIIL